MLYSFDDKLLGFCENKKIKSLPLYIFNNLNELNLADLINVEQKRFLKSAFDLENDNLGFFPDKNGALAGAIAILKASKEPKKSIIDQAAKISKKLPYVKNYIIMKSENSELSIKLDNLLFYEKIISSYIGKGAPASFLL